MKVAALPQLQPIHIGQGIVGYRRSSAKATVRIPVMVGVKLSPPKPYLWAHLYIPFSTSMFRSDSGLSYVDWR